MLCFVGVLRDLIAGPGIVQVAETVGVLAQHFQRLLAILIAVQIGLDPGTAARPEALVTLLVPLAPVTLELPLRQRRPSLDGTVGLSPALGAE